MTLSTDNDGFLLNLADWNADVAQSIASNEGIELSYAHWEVLHALREFHAKYDLSPAMRPLTRHLKESLGPEKSTSIYLLKLFPGSPAKIAAKIAGLPRPENCL